MTSIPREASGSGTEAAPSFIVTLCRLAAPVSIKPPQAPHLRRFQFFTSRTRQADGSVRLLLHMGFFSTLLEAQQYAERFRGSYPAAVASLAPTALVQQWAMQIPTLSPPAEAPSLTDTQVMGILDTRREGAVGASMHESTGAQVRDISLLRPDDTNTRRVLKEAVVQGAPVSFAVQLMWSPQPIDVARVPTLSIFRAYTLYQVQGKRDGRVWHCLRLGFFKDAITAKQVAYYVRSKFASVAVVPVSGAEREHGGVNRIDAAGAPVKETVRASEAAPASPSKEVPKERGGEMKSLEQTLEMLAASEIWNDPDSLSETGVRHLKIDFQQRTRKR